MKKAAFHLEIRIVKKNEYFFHEGEPSKFFAGLIKGKISFKKAKIFNRLTGEIIFRPLYRIVDKKEDMRSSVRKFTNRDEIRSIKMRQNMGINKKKLDPKRISVNNISNFSAFKSKFSLNDRPYKIVKEYFDPKYYRVIEDELFQAESGYCFGEWALIYNQPRSASVIALEDSVFFILDEKIFAKTFLKCLNNSEHKKKKFILDNLFPFNLYNDRRNSLYKDIIPKSCVRNQIIFNEGDNADTIYLIYSGTFFLEKNFKNKTVRFKLVEKGSILGLESLFEEKSQYKCSMRLSSLNEFGIVACCKVSKLAPYIVEKLKAVFKKIYMLYIESNEEFYSKNINYEKYILAKRRNKKGDNPEMVQKYIEEYSIKEKNEKIRNKKIKFNTLKQTKLDKINKLSDTEKNIIIDVLNNAQEKKKFFRKKKKAKTIKMNKKQGYTKYVDNVNKICYIFRRKQTKRMNTITPFSNKIGLFKENDENKSFEENDKNINLNMNKEEEENHKENNLKVIKLRKFNININLYIKNLLAYNYKPNIIENLKEKNKNNKKKKTIKTIKTIKTEESKSFNKTFYSNFNRKGYDTIISRNEDNEINTEDKISNFTELPTIKHNKYFRFDSGKYKLPLMAQIFKTQLNK